MGEAQEELWKDNLQFFGKATASISHEVKNILAIIGQSAGLLEDMVFMSEKGKELKTERLKQISALIQKQTLQADHVIRRLNSFSHSSDEAVKTIDILDTVKMVLSLAERSASLKGVELGLKHSVENLSITTDPFSLENLLWRCLDFAINKSDDKGSLLVDVAEYEGGGKVEISGIGNSPSGAVEEFPGPKESIIAEHLRASLSVRNREGSLLIGLPRNIVSQG